jgi:lipid-binding SYLF domain-containing protein
VADFRFAPNGPGLSHREATLANSAILTPATPAHGTPRDGPPASSTLNAPWFSDLCGREIRVVGGDLSRYAARVLHHKRGRKGTMKTLRTVAAGVASLLVASTAFATLSKHDVEKLNESAAVLLEIRNAPDNGIPERVWNSAQCVVVIPTLKKAAFIIGGEFGSGVMSCRHGGKWGAPVFMEMTKGSAGLQIGAQSVDLVLVVMNQSGVAKLLGNKVTLGADASVAAGPVGRSASAATDAQMKAEMLAYSRAKGLFAGVDVSGGSLRPDESANMRAYGPTGNARNIAMGTESVKIPVEAQAFINALGRDVTGTSGATKGTKKSRIMK